MTTDKTEASAIWRDQMLKAIHAAIRVAKSDGVTGMTIANLKQVISTRGLTCSVGFFHDSFEALARAKAAELRFTIIKGE